MAQPTENGDLPSSRATELPPEQPEAELKLEECKLCNRKFNESAMERHKKACETAHEKAKSAANRAKFNSGKQRSLGSDIPEEVIEKVKKESEQNEGKFERPKTAWREQHDQFLEKVKQAKEVSHAVKAGKPLPKPSSQRPKTSPENATTTKKSKK